MMHGRYLKSHYHKTSLIIKLGYSGDKEEIDFINITNKHIPHLAFRHFDTKGLNV